MNKSTDPINTRAFALDCIVVEVCPFTGVVLCKKNTERENAFITWKYYVENNEAHFYWGHYDMSLSDGATSYSNRVNEGLGK